MVIVCVYNFDFFWRDLGLVVRAGLGGQEPFVNQFTTLPHVIIYPRNQILSNLDQRISRKSILNLLILIFFHLFSLFIEKMRLIIIYSIVPIKNIVVVNEELSWSF